MKSLDANQDGRVTLAELHQALHVANVKRIKADTRSMQQVSSGRTQAWQDTSAPAANPYHTQHESAADVMHMREETDRFGDDTMFIFVCYRV